MQSYQDWDGLKSQKFRDKGRKKFQLAAPEIVTPRAKFDQQFGFPQQKQNENQSQLLSSQSQIAFTYKPNPNMVESTKLERYYSETSPKAQFVPIQRKYDFERKHLRQNKYGHLEDINYGIKTYEVANHETLDGFIVEDQMQRKIRVSNHRNGCTLSR